MSQTEKTIQNYRTLREQQGWADAIKKYLSEKYETPPLAHVHSFGCQQNVSDGEKIKGALLERALGYDADEVVEEYGFSEGEAVLVKRKVTRKRVPPDIQAAKMLLDSAPPLTSLSDEQLQKEKERLLLLLKEEQT